MPTDLLKKIPGIGPADNVDSSRAIRSRASRSIREAQKEVDKAGLHAKEVKSPKFEKLSASDTSLDKDLQKLLKRYKVDSDKYHGAAISEDGNSLVISHDGLTTLKENFGGASSISRFANKVFGIFSKSSKNKAMATAKYKEFFNNYDADQKDLSMVMEPISHLFKGLASNHYHGVSIFHKDTATGKFMATPSAISIIDSYEFIFNEHSQGNEMPEKVKAQKATFENAYALDKTIPLDKEKSQNFSGLLGEIAEGLYAAQGYSFLTIPGQIHNTLTANSDELNYVELPWHRVQQSADKKWRAQADKKKLDAEIYASTDDKEFYESRLIDSEYTNLTVVRPKAKEKEAINPFIGYMENWSQMYSGNALRAKDKDNKRLIDLAQSFAAHIIETFNAEYLK